MNEPFAARREKLRRAMRARGLDVLLISRAANRFYLSGFELHDPQCNESAGRLAITADGRDWLATDARYLDAAARLWDTERIFIYGANAAKDLHGLLRRCGSRVGLEADGVSLAFAREIADAGPAFSGGGRRSDRKAAPDQRSLRSGCPGKRFRAQSQVAGMGGRRTDAGPQRSGTELGGGTLFPGKRGV